jgi:hypothetical protein
MSTQIDLAGAARQWGRAGSTARLGPLETALRQAATEELAETLSARPSSKDC